MGQQRVFNNYMEIDLDIQNYSLEEILNLFKIPINFDENDLKRAKGLVLKSHPDKSKLDAKYFIFYSKAYKALFSIYEFKNKTRMDQSTEYRVDENNTHLKKYLEKNKLTDKNFYKWFNDEFEKRKDREEQVGYEDWLKSNEDIETTNVKLNEMNHYFETKKKDMVKDMVKYEEVRDYTPGNNNYTNLRQEESYHSDMFSSLHYSDLKQAHTQSIIPVSLEEFAKKPQYSVTQYKNFRQTEDIKNIPLSNEESKKLLQNKMASEEEESMTRAYYYAKKTQESEKANRDFLAKMKLLEYGI